MPSSSADPLPAPDLPLCFLLCALAAIDLPDRTLICHVLRTCGTHAAGQPPLCYTVESKLKGCLG